MSISNKTIVGSVGCITIGVMGCYLHDIQAILGLFLIIWLVNETKD